MYQYDKGGNRVSEKIYAYTLSDTLGTAQQEIVSEYDSLVWNDLLTSYNGKEITYDNAGNPTSYDGKTFVWNGKQLTQITAADGSKTVFDYDANGLRTRKTQYDADGKLEYYVEYIWDDGKIVSQYLTLMVRGTIMNEYKEFAFGPIPSKVIYDDSGIPQGFTCGETTYGFVRNLQGDVIAMVDMNGNIVMEYSYDPWGNIEYHLNEEITTEEDAIIYTALCPLTYRGYNYDFTTGLYYLQSRYYNPEWGRFLNCDDTAILLATQGETHNANLFAYCANNPVNRLDYNGRESVPLSILLPTVIIVTYGVFIAPMSAHIMTLDLLMLNYSHIEKYDIFMTTSTWYKHKWYYYEYYDIITYGGTVQGWYELIDTVKPYLTAQAILGVIVSAASLTKYNPTLMKIATAIGIPFALIALLASDALDKIENNLRFKQPDDWYIFNWRVTLREKYLFNQEQTINLYLYSPIAALI